MYSTLIIISLSTGIAIKLILIERTQVRVALERQNPLNQNENDTNNYNNIRNRLYSNRGIVFDI